jgi:hypothetical protein
MKSNGKNTALETVREYRKKNKKPRPMRVVMPDGKVRFLGTQDAAKWIDCTPAALGMVLRGIPGRLRCSSPECLSPVPHIKTDLFCKYLEF